MSKQLSLAEKLRDILLRIPTARTGSGGREVIMRCRYCSDGKDPKSAHMYVSLPSEDTPSLHNCYKCGTKGIVTHEKLLSWLVYDVDVSTELITHNAKVMSLDKNRKFKDSQVYRIDNNFITMGDLSNIKLKYINNRIGTNLTFQDLVDNKIVLNLGDLLGSNNIKEYTRHINLVKQLDECFLGFVSQDNAFVNLRCLTPGKVHSSIDKKYVNYNIFNKFDNTMRYYTIPANIDLCNPNRIKLHIAEGPFDILSIYHNLRKKEEHSIYSAICGSGYLNIVKHFIHTMKLLNLEIHIYKDADIEDYVLYEMRDIMYIYNIPFYIHRNMYPNEKDFGIPINRIDEKIQKIA
jgi:hypothetical protein